MNGIASKFKDIVLIVIGTLITSVAINIFYLPNDVVTGGFSGIGIILQSVSSYIIEGGVPISLTNIILNIPVFILAFFMLGQRYVAKTAFATVLFSVMLEVTSFLPEYRGDLALTAIYGGIIDGIGIGLVLRAMASTGGVDLVASLVHKKFGHISVSYIMFLINFFIIAVGFFVFGAEKTMYAIISVFISSKFVNVVLEGLSFSKAAFIISEKSHDIAKRIMTESERGVTALKGRGMYTGNDKDILMCVFARKEITKIKEIVRNMDPSAFIILTDITEVMGEGFKDIYAEN